MLDLVFVCLDIHNEHKCVIVLYFFHGRLCSQRELDDGIVIQPKEEEIQTFDLNLYGYTFLYLPRYKCYVVVLGASVV